ncbi:MAG: DNA mismatch repair endonuclease MutL [Oscillospiraceae bacterium]
MPHIQCLAPHVADLIAAGEVVERPASVVKELVENAVDAGASAVAVEIRRGGMELIRVSDNGCGIAPEELPTAFLRHATSKLRQESDLAAIGTLGFRGEALAAIAAVSHVEIVSRSREREGGASLRLSAGAPEAVEEAPAAEGTVIAVRDLFFNTPARLKFMKKDASEAAAVHSVLQQLALSHPEVSLRLVKDGQEVLHTPGDGKLLSAVYAALGRDFALGLTEVAGSGGSVSCRGFVTKPLMGRGTRGMQIFFVNGRLVKSQLLTAALEEGYRNQLLKGKFPGCVMHLTLPVREVDVNVHPAKTVVKFLNEKAVFDAVYYTVLDALAAPRGVAEAKPAAEQRNPRGDFYQTMRAEEFRRQGEKATAKPAFTAKPEPKPQSPAFVAREDTGFVSQVPPVKSGESALLRAEDSALPFYRVEKVETKLVDRATGGETAVPGAAEAPVFTIRPPKRPETESAPASEKAAAGKAQEVIPTPAAGPKVFAPAKETAPEQAALPLAEDAQQTLLREEAPWRIAGEVLKTYIVCEDEGGTVHLIDKHAAHERILFDKLKAGTYEVMGQMLLSPIAAEIGAEGCAVLLERRELLEEFGFLCEDFGPGALLLRQLPADIDPADAASALEMLAEKLLSCRNTDPAAARDAMLHTVACKAAIKAGMNSSEAELRALVRRVQSGEIRYCPHGRPVEASLTKYQLEKMFRRA